MRNRVERCEKLGPRHLRWQNGARTHAQGSCGSLRIWEFSEQYNGQLTEYICLGYLLQ